MKNSKNTKTTLPIWAFIIIALNTVAICLLGYYFHGMSQHITTTSKRIEELNDKMFTFHVFFEEQKERISTEITDMKKNNDNELKKVSAAILYSYDDFDKKSKALVSWLTETEGRMRSLVSVHDKNVEIYNKQYSHLSNQLQSLQAETNKHREVLILLARGR